MSEKGRIYLRAVNSHRDSHGPMLVVSSVPLDKNFLGKIASKIGSLTVYSQVTELNRDEKSLENAISNAQSAGGRGFRPNQRRQSIRSCNGVGPRI